MARTGRRIASLGSPVLFQRVISGGERLTGRYVLLFWDRSDRPGIRVGVSASGKAGCNVVRNRLRRLLREAVRREAGRLGPGYDLVLIAKAAAVGRTLDDIAGDVGRLFSELAAGRGRTREAATGATEEVRGRC